MPNSQTVKQAIIEASQRWRTSFNAGDALGCAACYTQISKMEARPFGTYEGRDAIYQFWKSFIETEATNVEYTNIAINVLNDTQGILTAKWSMNVGRGVVDKELWVKDNDGLWRLEDDIFTVEEQYDKT